MSNQFVGFCNGALTKNACASFTRNKATFIRTPVSSNGVFITGSNYPNTNQPIYGGKTLVVFDFDIKDPNFDPKSVYDYVLPTYTVRSGGGGLHCYYWMEGPVPIKHYIIKDLTPYAASLGLKGIDIQADGGLIFAEGTKFSTHPYSYHEYNASPNNVLQINTIQYDQILANFVVQTIQPAKTKPKQKSTHSPVNKSIVLPPRQKTLMREAFRDIMSGKYQIVEHCKDEQVYWKMYFIEGLFCGWSEQELINALSKQDIFDRSETISQLPYVYKAIGDGVKPMTKSTYKEFFPEYEIALGRPKQSKDINPATVVRLIVNNIAESNETIADDNFLYIKRGLYFDQITKNEFIRDFLIQYNDVRTDWLPKFGIQAWDHITKINYKKDVIDQYIHLIPFKNGLYDLNEKTFTDNTDGIFITNYFDYSYIPDAKCPQFEKAMLEILPDDTDREFFLTYINYAFGGSIELQLALILKGEGENGKSKLIEFILQIMGKRATTVDFNKLSEDNSKCKLIKSTLCYSAEIGGNYLYQKEMDKIKNLITDIFQSGRRPFGQTEDWKNITKFIASCNSLPQVQTYEKAFFRRWKIIFFPSDFSKNPDRTLFDRILNDEGGAVISWILQNYSDHSVLKIDWIKTAEIWKFDSDPIRKFIKTECKIIPNGEEISSTIDVYTAYAYYCNRSGLKPISEKYFKSNISKLGHPAFRIEGNTWGHRQLTLKDESQNVENASTDYSKGEVYDGQWHFTKQH